MPDHTPRTIALTGAAGFLGRYITRELLRRGYHVRALARDRAKAAKHLPADPKLTVVFGDLLEGRCLPELLAGADACVNTIGIIRPAKGQTFEQMHVDTVRALTDACRTAPAPVRRFVHISALGVSPDGKAEYQRTKFAGEQVLRRSGLDWTILRPSLIHGPDGGFTQQVLAWCKGDTAPFFFIPYFTRFVEHDEGVPMGRITFDTPLVAPVSVLDVAAAVAESLARPQSVGEIYNLVGSETINWRTMLESFRDALPGADTALPVIGVPGTPHAHLAKAAGILGLGALLPFDEGQAMMAQEDSTASLDKVKAHLGISPRAFHTELATYAPLVTA